MRRVVIDFGFALLGITMRFILQRLIPKIIEAVIMGPVAHWIERNSEKAFALYLKHHLELHRQWAILRCPQCK